MTARKAQPPPTRVGALLCPRYLVDPLSRPLRATLSAFPWHTHPPLPPQMYLGSETRSGGTAWPQLPQTPALIMLIWGSHLVTFRRSEA